MTGHFKHKYNRPWKHVDRPLTPILAKMFGAKDSEISHSGTLTGNMHSLFTTFYNPSATRWKIVIEKGSFPTDWFAAHSHPNLHAATLSKDQIANAVIALEPREGEETLRTEDILAVLDENKDEVGLELYRVTPSTTDTARLRSCGCRLSSTTAASCLTPPPSPRRRTRLARSWASTWRTASAT